MSEALTEVAIATKAGRRPVACVATDTPGLVLTRTFFGDPEMRKLGLWTVTHADSGHAVIPVLPNRSTAAMAARWLGQHGVDWLGGMEDVLASQPARSAVATVRAQAESAVKEICDLVDIFDPQPEESYRKRCNGAWSNR